MPTTITTNERRYCASEAAYLIRKLVGPLFGNVWTLMADQRRGRATVMPFVRFHGKKTKPHYLWTDLVKFVETVRADPTTGPAVKANVPPIYEEVDIAKLMMI